MSPVLHQFLIEIIFNYFYKSELSLSLLLEKLRIDDTQLPYTTYGDNTISVTRDLFEIINDKIPYMISMISADISSIALEDISPKSRDEHDIPDPQNEPVIGVIDTFLMKVCILVSG